MKSFGPLITWVGWWAKVVHVVHVWGKGWGAVGVHRYVSVDEYYNIQCKAAAVEPLYTPVMTGGPTKNSIPRGLMCKKSII